MQPDRVVHPGSWLEHIPFAFWLVDVLRPGTLVELGTHSGNSYAAFAQAIATLQLPAAAYSVDSWSGDSQAGFYGEDVFADWSRYHDAHFSAFSRLVRSTFEEALQHFPDGSIDLLHLDGCHIYESVQSDFSLWQPKLSARGVILFHDTNVRERDFGAWRLWGDLKANHPSFEFLHGHGLGVLGVGSDLPDDLRWLFTLGARGGHDVHVVRQFFATIGGAIAGRFAATEIERRLRHESDAERRAAQEAIAQRDAQLAQRDQELAERDRELVERDQELAWRDADLAIEHRRLLETTDACAQLGDDLAATESSLTAARTRLEEQDAERERLLAALDDRARDISALRGRLKAAASALHHRVAAPVSVAKVSGPASVQLQPARTTLAGVRRRLRTPAALGALPTRRRRRIYRSGIRLALDRVRLRQAHAVLLSGLFDEAFYAGRYGDVRASGMTPLTHYLLTGGLEGRAPHPLFDGAYYLRNNPDVAAARQNPLLHYIQQGAAEGRNPHPLFDIRYYLETYPDVRAGGMEPLAHFLQFGASEGRSPHPLFDSTFYFRSNPDVAAGGQNPLVHFITDGWRERRRPSRAFDLAHYVAQDPGILASGQNPLVHFLEHGRREGRSTGADQTIALAGQEPLAEPEAVVITVRSLGPAGGGAGIQRTVLCLSHVMPVPPRAGNEYRIHRLLRWLHSHGYRIVPVIAPLPGEQVSREALETLAEEFGNAVLCGRDGQVEYILRDVPDVLRSLDGELTEPVSLLLDENEVRGEHSQALLQMDRTFCHDVLISTTLRLQQVLGPHVLLAEYIWMSRILPLMPHDVIKVIDTIDVFSTKRDKVLRFGIDDIHVSREEEIRRLGYADLVIAIQEDERRQLQELLPGRQVVTAGVDFDRPGVDAEIPNGRHVLLVASDNPMNKKGLVDFVRFAWPQIHRALPDAELLVAGNVGQALRGNVAGVTRLGRVADLTTLYREARVVINPAVAGTGLKIKTLEALVHQRPIVTWPSGTDGVSPTLAGLCDVVTDWYEFAQRVIARLSDQATGFSAAEQETIAEQTSPSTVYQEMSSALDAIEQRRPTCFDGPRL